jgi:hypothetical protein
MFGSASQEAELACPRDGSGAIAYTKPLKDSMQMPFGRANSNGHLARHFGVRKPARDMSEDCDLRRGQRGDRCMIPLSCRHQTRDHPRGGSNRPGRPMPNCVAMRSSAMRTHKLEDQRGEIM